MYKQREVNAFFNLKAFMYPISKVYFYFSTTHSTFMVVKAQDV